MHKSYESVEVGKAIKKVVSIFKAPESVIGSKAIKKGISMREYQIQNKQKMENQYLEHVLVMLDQVEEKVKSSFCGLTDEQLNWQPNKKTWSIGSGLDHLVLSNKMYFEVLDAVKNNSQYKGFWTKLPLWSTVWGKILINSVDPIRNKKSKTTKDLDTIGGKYTQQIVDNFLNTQSKLKVLAYELDGYDHKKIVIAFPTIKSITMKVDVAFNVLWKHELKHYNQAVRVMEADGFPK